MSTRVQLFKKEWRIIRFPFFIGLLFLLFIHLSTLLPSTFRIFMPASLVTQILLICIPALLLYSLQIEARQLQQWLHSPFSVDKLLKEKVGCCAFGGLLLAGFNLLLDFVYPLGLNHQDLHVSLIIFLNSFFFISNVLLLWALYQWLKRKFKKWGFVITCVFLIPCFHYLKNLWGISGVIEPTLGGMTASDGFFTSVGLLIALIWFFVFFYISSEIIERYVE